MNMRVLLRDGRTGQYYAGLQGWVENSIAAADFDKVEDATHFSRNQNLAAMEVVLHYEQPPCDLVLPVRQDW